MPLRRSLAVCSLFLATVLSSFPLPAAGDTIGIVLMHGKNGSASSGAPVGKLATRLEDEGYLVTAPDMTWSRSRGFDQTFDAAMAEIDAAVAEIKQRGAAKVVVGGHSLGAAMALGYGARRDGLAGILAIAPGHAVDIPGFQQRVGNDYRRAQKMIDAGQGDDRASFNDINQGRKSEITVTAKVYLSWFAPDSPIAMSRNASNLRPGTPLMWIFGEKDKLMVRRGRDYAFARASAHPKNSYLVVKGGHMATPKVGAGDIIAWLKGL